MSTSKQFIRGAMLTLLVWGASVPIAEFAFRLAGIHVSGAMGGFYEPFGDRGFKPRPNAEAFMNWFSGPFHVYIDGAGLRVGADRKSAVGPAGDLDVLVMGDSQAFGQGVEYEKSLVGTFAELAAKDSLRVGNAAVGAYFLRNQFEFVEWLVKEKGLKPRVLMICLTPRNLGEPDAYMDTVVHDGQLWDAPPSRAKRFRAWLSSNSSVYLVVRNVMRELTSHTPPAKGDLYLFRYHTGEERQARVSKAVERLTTFLAALGPERPKLVFSYLPLATDLEIEAAAAAQSAGDPDVHADAPLDAAKAVAAAFGALLIDVSPVLEQRRKDSQPISLDGDPHYNAQTSRSAGEMVYNSVNWRDVLSRPR